MENKRILTYDYLRGFAMFSIVIGHLLYYSGRASGSLAFQICDTIEIPVFMYISGLLAHISVDRYGFRKLIATKVVRLLFPLFSFYVIWSLWDSSLWLGFWTKEFKNGYWFMLVLFELMVTLSFVKQVSMRFNVKSVYVNTVVYAFVILLCFLLKDGWINTLFCLKLYLHYYPFFMMGYYSYRLDRFLLMKYAPFYLLVYVLAFLCMDGQWRGPAKLVCNLFSLLFLLSLFSSSFQPLKKVFAEVGINSLQVYMIHFFLLFPLLKVLPVVENRWLEFLYYTVVATAIIFVTIAFSKLLMKNKWLAMLLFGVRPKKKTA